jgi:DNA-binding MarR family transcriptional regulator
MSSSAVAAVDAKLASSLRTSVMRLGRRLRRERTTEDLTLSQLAVLGTLDRCGGQSIGELAEHEKISSPSMTRIVNHLVEAGLVARRPHETDGRQVVIELTPTARSVLEDDRRRRDAWLARRLGDLTPDERELLRQAAPLLEIVASS